ncbi:MAG TPA: sodium:alanine symporter family protein [Gemmatimonadota bacterium]|nr:sodium:alanine symporter family protein [Gemmatimonadota bacterium]
METFERIVEFLDGIVWGTGFRFGGELLPIVVIALIGTGVWLTLYLGFVQLRRLGHGFAVTSGKYDDPDEPGDVSHFQALTTALSATVGIGNIAGVAIAIHWGGPGALFWMWVTAFLGMATKFTEVTLAQHYRSVTAPDQDPTKWEGTVAGGPMYYIERGLGPKWRPMAILFAVLLGTTAFMTGNAIQANTIADSMETTYGVPVWVTGLVTSLLVFSVIIGGIRRIGSVTAVLAPLMAVIYVAGAAFILIVNYQTFIPSLGLIFREAFNPSAGIAGTGLGVFLTTMMWGVRRGLFSNEAGQGSAPIAHAAAKTDEPVSEGVVALLEPFIDTIVICTMTALVIINTGVWDDTVTTQISLSGGDMSYVSQNERGGYSGVATPADALVFEAGRPTSTAPGDPMIAWHEVALTELYEDAELTQPFSGSIDPRQRVATSADGEEFTALWGPAVESGAPLTMLGFEHGLPGTWGDFIVLLSVALFAISTAISWSYYGDRCAYYLFGKSAIIPYKVVYVIMHFIGAVVPLAAIWALGDVFLGVVILPNLLALILLSPKVKELTNSYFARKPWIENYEAHKRAREAVKAGKRKSAR